MESLKNWLNDKKNLPIIIGGAVVVVVLVAAVWFFLRPGSTPEPAAVPAGIPGTPGGAQAPPGTAPVGGPGAMGPMPPGAAMTPGAPAPGVPGAAPETQVATGPAKASAPPLEDYRPDPFRPYFGPKPKRTPMTFTARLPKPDIRSVSPVIVKQVEQAETLPPQPTRRMAGLLKDDRVYAVIIEGETADSPGRTLIVKPGDPVDENLAVDRILPDRVILRSTRTKRPIYIDVLKSAGQFAMRPSGTSGSPPGGAAGAPPPSMGTYRGNRGTGGAMTPPAP